MNIDENVTFLMSLMGLYSDLMDDEWDTPSGKLVQLYSDFSWDLIGFSGGFSWDVMGFHGDFSWDFMGFIVT